MARTAITPQKATSAGLTLATEPANVDGNMIPLSSGMVLVVTNASGAEITVTFPTPATVDGLAVADRAVAVPAGATGHVALGSSRVYRQPDGTAHVDYSAVSSVTVALLQAV
ncbi:MAG TPA: hypothetical protein VIQ30_22645 [Pseudonocardia sp.]